LRKNIAILNGYHNMLCIGVKVPSPITYMPVSFIKGRAKSILHVSQATNAELTTHTFSHNEKSGFGISEITKLTGKAQRIFNPVRACDRLIINVLKESVPELCP